MNWTIIIIETIVLTLAFTAMILIPLVKKIVSWVNKEAKCFVGRNYCVVL